MAGGGPRTWQSHSDSQKARVMGPDGVAAGADVAICGDLRAELHAIFTSTAGVGPHRSIFFDGEPDRRGSPFIWTFPPKINTVAGHSVDCGWSRHRYLFGIHRSPHNRFANRAD